MASRTSAEDFSSTKVVVLVADLTLYHRAFNKRTDQEMAAFLDRFFTMAESVISEAGGRIIKFLGDAVLAIFQPEDAAKAVAATVAMQAFSQEMAREVGVDMKLGANLHAGPVVCAELGSGDSRRFDIIGRVVNQTSMLGRGAGIRLSERMYRLMPSDERSPWDKHKPPAVYVLGEGGVPYAGAGGSVAKNIRRW